MKTYEVVCHERIVENATFHIVAASELDAIRAVESGDVCSTENSFAWSEGLEVIRTKVVDDEPQTEKAKENRAVRTQTLIFFWDQAQYTDFLDAQRQHAVYGGFELGAHTDRAKLNDAVMAVGELCGVETIQTTYVTTYFKE